MEIQLEQLALFQSDEMLFSSVKSEGRVCISKEREVFIRRIQFLLSFVLKTTLCGFGIKVSLHFVRFVKSVATRQRIVSSMESVGGVAPLTTRRMRASGRGVSLLYQWRWLSLRWWLAPLGLLCLLSLIVLPFWRVRLHLQLLYLLTSHKSRQ